MFRPKNILDERQEKEMLIIEHRACVFMYSGLAFDCVIGIVTGNLHLSFSIMIGIFFFSCIYIASSSMRKGIWDRYLRPNHKTNLVISLLSTGIVFLLLIAGLLFRIMNEGEPIISNFRKIFPILLFSAFFFIFVFALISILSSLTIKKQRKLDEEYCNDK